MFHALKAAATSVWTGTAYKTTVKTNEGATALTASPGSTSPEGDVPNCTPAKYRLPTPLDVQGLPDGVTTFEDSLQQYTIYGNTADDRLRQLQRCAPTGEYAGAASYQITWQYGYMVRSDGLCQIIQPKIALHLAMILPRWQPGSDVSADELATWNAYIRALSTHEQGHYQISQQYAGAMLDGLNQLPAQACSDVKGAADKLLETKLTQLNAAQNNYDDTTNHGATQGAVL
jgi:predicted secreted Zn-dependent protease